MLLFVLTIDHGRRDDIAAVQRCIMIILSLIASPSLPSWYAWCFRISPHLRSATLCRGLASWPNTACLCAKLINTITIYTHTLDADTFVHCLFKSQVIFEIYIHCIISPQTLARARLPDLFKIHHFIHRVKSVYIWDLQVSASWRNMPCVRHAIWPADLARRLVYKLKCRFDALILIIWEIFIYEH